MTSQNLDARVFCWRFVFFEECDLRHRFDLALVWSPSVGNSASSHDNGAGVVGSAVNE